jgi:putative ATP-dependent endonuclease of OLD family
VRPTADKHEVRPVGAADDVQRTIRLYPDAFLAPYVIVCEGASEVGLVRGLDQYRAANGQRPISAKGASLVDCGGGEADKSFKRAAAFHALGYRAAIVRDDDLKPTEAVESAFIAGGGKVVAWRNGRTLEDELFVSLTDDGIDKLIERAVELHGEELVNEHIKSASQNEDLNTVQTEVLIGITSESREILGKAARTKRAGWFKSVTWMEDVARDIVGPDLTNADAGFRSLIDEIFAWA